MCELLHTVSAIEPSSETGAARAECPETADTFRAKSLAGKRRTVPLIDGRGEQ